MFQSLPLMRRRSLHSLMLLELIYLILFTQSPSQLGQGCIYSSRPRYIWSSVRLTLEMGDTASPFWCRALTSSRHLFRSPCQSSAWHICFEMISATVQALFLLPFTVFWGLIFLWVKSPKDCIKMNSYSFFLSCIPCDKNVEILCWYFDISAIIG